MKRKFSVVGIVVVVVLIVFVAVAIPVLNGKNKATENGSDNASEIIHHVTGIVLYKDEDYTTIQSKDDDEIYKFDKDEVDEKQGTEVSIDYKKEEPPSKPNQKPDVNKPSQPSGSSSSNVPSQKEENSNNTVIDYTVVEKSKIPDSWLDGGIFSSYYTQAYKLLQSMTLEEKIGQTLIVRYPNTGATAMVDHYHYGGYVFYEKDFTGKTREQVINMINAVQNASKIPLLTAIDEEGGTVSRLSRNTALTSTPFRSPQDLYNDGGFDAIVSDTKNKSNVLSGLGLNLNFAPVVDVSTDPSNYIYKRTLGQGTELTATYASTVITASKGTGVSYTLKHFPGYGSNADTHYGGSSSKKSYADVLKEDIPPFKVGIEAGAEAVMVSHNIVECIDSANESSISPQMHKLLRDDLKFTGIIVTDDIGMGAMANVTNVGGKAISAGNDLIITTDGTTTFNQIKSSITDGSVKQDTLDRAVFRILAWKYYKNLL